MSATCRVWLSELDKGREHYKDFNDKNKYTGWRSGLVKTAEIQVPSTFEALTRSPYFTLNGGPYSYSYSLFSRSRSTFLSLNDNMQ